MSCVVMRRAKPPQWSKKGIPQLHEHYGRLYDVLIKPKIVSGPDQTREVSTAALLSLSSFSPFPPFLSSLLFSLSSFSSFPPFLPSLLFFLPSFSPFPPFLSSLPFSSFPPFFPPFLPFLPFLPVLASFWI